MFYADHIVWPAHAKFAHQSFPPPWVIRHKTCFTRLKDWV